MMKRSSIYRSAATAAAVATIALLCGCGTSQKALVTPPVAPKFLYASSCDTTATVLGYSVDAATGALTPLAGNPVITGLNCPDFMVSDPAQKFLFVPDDGDELIHAYAIGATGALTEVGTPPSQCVFQLAVDSSGKFLVAPDFCSNDIDVYSIGANGALTAVAGSPFSGTSKNQPESAWIDPAGKFVYVTESTDGPGTISVFSLSAAGALTEIVGSPFASGGNSFTIAGTPDGKFVYATDFADDKIMAYSANTTTGALTPLSTPSFDSGTCWLSVDVTGKVLFATDCAGGLLSFVINADGTLTPATGSPAATGGTASYPVTGDPSGAYVYVGEDGPTGKIFAYKYTSAGVLTAVTGSPFAATGGFIEGIFVTH